MERHRTSPAERVDPRSGERGFALVEILCVLAIIGLLAAILLPAIPRATSRARLESYAVEAAGLLKADRNAALRRQIRVTTRIDAAARTIRSGVTGRTITLPTDVALDAVLAAKCASQPAGRSIDFFPSGMSCGGAIAFSRPGMGYEVRVNWLTGGVEVVPQKLSRRDAGFTLIEALVALAILATVLSSIGMVIATTVKGTRAIDQRLAVSGVAETLLAALPARDVIKPGTQTGTMAGHRWRMDIVALNAGRDAPAGRWTPVSIKLRVQSPGGPAVQLTTVRLVQAGS